MTIAVLSLLLALQFEIVPIDESRFEDLKEDVDSVLDISNDNRSAIADNRVAIARVEEKTSSNTWLLRALLAANGALAGGGAYGYKKLANK